MKPTDEQIKELWLASGLGRNDFGNWGVWVGRDSGRQLDIVTATGEPPLIDLNNLSKWAVPKAVGEIKRMFKLTEHSAYRTLFGWWLDKFSDDTRVDLALALFWACYKVLVKEEL